MARGKINKRSVDALRPIDGRHVLLWDDELPGFGVRCLPSGKKFYHLKYRTRGGRGRWLTLGQHGPLTPDRARAKALREKAAVIDGYDPAGELETKRREITIAEVADRYLAEHAAVHNKPRTVAEARRVVETKIKPRLGWIKITDLTRSDIKAWHQAMSATPYEANRALAHCSKMLSLAAKDWELRDDNPCLGMQRFREWRRERYFSDAELARIGAALGAVDRDGAELPGFTLLIRLLATTGMRLSEALGLLWSDVDLAGRKIRLQDAKAGARTVYLGADAVAILNRATGCGGYVIHGIEPTEPLSRSTAENAWRRLRKRAQITNGRLQDLRHTAGTFAGHTGANAFIVRDLLGHRTLAMTGRYVHPTNVFATADAVSGRMAAALNSGAAAPAEIVKLAGRQ